MKAKVILRAKRKLRDHLYTVTGRVRRGGLTRAGEALGVRPATIRSWAICDWNPSYDTAVRILTWLSTKPKIEDYTGSKSLGSQN